MRKTKIIWEIASILFISLVLMGVVSAISIDEIRQDKLYPGEQTKISVDVKNTLNDRIENVNLIIDFSNSKFISVGSASGNKDGIDEDDTETFNFNIKASSDIKPGDYNIPYILTYEVNLINRTDIISEKGTIGISVGARTELDYAALTENPIVGQKGKVSIKIINSGLGEIKFINVKIIPNGFTLLGNNENYIGTVSSNDYETATFDVIFKSERARVAGVVEYKDFDNNKQTQTVDLPITVYSKEKALELGIIKKDNTWIYGIVIITMIILWFTYRTIRKRRKKKNQGA